MFKQILMEVQDENIIIDQYLVLAELQEAFANKYPFLKIDFVEAEPKTGAIKPKELNPITRLNRLPIQQANAIINIGGNRTVAEVNDEFLKKLGVCIQVSRNSGKVWNVITVTENWTLKTQNAAAEFISSLMKLSPL